MKGTTKTRTQRRMEKRQAIILLVLVLAVSLASFTLGVMVGRRGAERDLAQRMLQTEKVLVAEIPPHATVPAAVAEAAPASEDAPSAVPTEEKKLSFYDDLAKDTVPLGSGINLAPAEDQPKTETAVRPPVDLPDKPIVEKEPPPAEKNQVAAVKETKKPVAKAAEATAERPKMSPHGSHAVQIGSFNSAGDAIALKEKMLKLDYPAFVVEADLAGKGLWYRVRIGPYRDAVAAKTVQKQLHDQERIDGFVARQ